jgi:hypothetical protein
MSAYKPQSGPEESVPMEPIEVFFMIVGVFIVAPVLGLLAGGWRPKSPANREKGTYL